MLSIVVPVYNERESLGPLHVGLSEALVGCAYEILFVDDGCTDGSYRQLLELSEMDAHVRVIAFGRNLGKAAALAAGFREARGEIVVTIDGDLQDDPAEIPRLLAKIDEGYDLVIGWKERRQDPLLAKRLPSLLFNRATMLISGLSLHDFNSGFKACRRELVESLPIYGDQYRFMPAIAHWRGFRVAEVPVRHRPRRFGRSKYGVSRFLAGFFDLLTVLFLTRFHYKPLHLFGSVGLACFLLGLGINLYLTMLRLAGQSIGTRPLLQLGVLLVVTGLQFFSLGLLGEMLTLSNHQHGELPHAYRVLGGASKAGCPDDEPPTPRAPAMGRRG